MEHNNCAAHDCENIIRSNRATAKYCSPACKTRHHRYRKENGISGVGSVRSAKPSGNIVADFAMTAITGGISNAINDKPIQSNLEKGTLSATLPYLKGCIVKRPLLSIVSAFVGYKLADTFFSSCSTTIKGSQKTRTCTNATGIQKGMSSGLLVLAMSHICDNLPKYADMASSVTLQKRHSDVTDTLVTPKVEYYQPIPN